MSRKKALSCGVAFLAVLSAASAAVAHSFPKAEYYRPVGTETKKTKGELRLDSEARKVRFFAKKSQEPVLEIAYDDIEKMIYEKSAKPRYAAAVFISPLFLLSRSKKHWLTIEHKDGGETRRTVIRLDKKNYENALSTLTEETGVKVDLNVAIE